MTTDETRWHTGPVVPANTIRVSVIGRMGVAVPDSGFRRLQPAQRQLLSLLVAAGPSGLTADRIADEIWPDQLPNQWQAAVRMTVSRLRRSCNSNFVEMADGYYRLTLGLHQVDAWYLNELTDRSEVSLIGADVERLGELVASTEIYGGVEGTLTVDGSIREIEQAQRTLIAALAKQSFRLPRSILRALFRRVIATPWDEDLCADVASLHAAAGLTAAAQDLIDQTRLELRDTFGVPPTDRLLRIERQLAHGRFDSPDVDELVDQVSDTAVTLPVALQVADGKSDVRVEATAELIEQLSGDRSTLLLTGPAGSASHVLIGHALTAMGSDVGTVLYGRCSEGVTLSYEPFVGMLPNFRSLVARDFGAEETAGPTVLWAAAAEELAQAGRGGPVTVVVGAAHDIDSASTDLLLFLARSNMEISLRLLITGLSDVDRPEFARLERSLASIGNTRRATIAPLTVDQITLMAGEDFPHASSAALRSLSEELLVRSGGLPTVVAALLRTLDPATLRLPASGTGQSLDVFSQQVSGLSDTARSVGIAAAVLGRDASLSDLQHMCELHPDELLDVVEELLDTGLIVETAGVDRLTFAHQLAMDEFINQTREIRRRQMHVKARNLTTDPHRRARHDLLAHPTVPSAEARTSQLRSARILHAQRSFREAAAAFRNAQSLQPDLPLETKDAVAYADSVSRTGALAEAAQLRSEVIARCISDGEWDGVLAGAIVGLPEAELIDGDPERFAQLSSIPAERLDDDKRFQLAIHLSRQASLLGRDEVAQVWVGRAQESAMTASQKAAATFAWRLANDVRTPARQRLDRVQPALSLPVADADRVPLLQVAALDSYQVGNIDEAVELNRQFAEAANASSNPLRIWHSRLFSAMYLFEVGAWDQARAEADRALEDGLRFGVTIAGPTRMAQEFWLYLLKGEQGSLAPLFEMTPPDDASTLLFQSAYSRSLFAVGETQRAINKALSVVKRFLAAPQAHGLAATALLAPVLEASGDTETVDAVRELLRPHADSALLVGAGVVNLGPVDRYLSRLDGEPTADDCRRFVAQSDRLNMPVWRVHSRLELRRVLSDAGVVDEVLNDEITRISTGTSFEELL